MYIKDFLYYLLFNTNLIRKSNIDISVVKTVERDILIDVD